MRAFRAMYARGSRSGKTFRDRVIQIPKNSVVLKSLSFPSPPSAPRLHHTNSLNLPRRYLEKTMGASYQPTNGNGVAVPSYDAVDPNPLKHEPAGEHPNRHVPGAKEFYPLSEPAIGTALPAVCIFLRFNYLKLADKISMLSRASSRRTRSCRNSSNLSRLGTSSPRIAFGL